MIDNDLYPTLVCDVYYGKLKIDGLDAVIARRNRRQTDKAVSRYASDRDFDGQYLFARKDPNNRGKLDMLFYQDGFYLCEAGQENRKYLYENVVLIRIGELYYLTENGEETVISSDALCEVTLNAILKELYTDRLFLANEIWLKEARSDTEKKVHPELKRWAGQMYEKACALYDKDSGKIPTFPAWEWAVLAAWSGHPDAGYLLACMYRNGSTDDKNAMEIRQNMDRSGYWISSGVISGHPSSMLDYGLRFYELPANENNGKQAEKWIRQALETNGLSDGEAAIAKDALAKIGSWKTHEQNLINSNPSDPEEQFELACCYMNGEFVEQNDERAVFWMRESAEHGFDKAQVVLAGMYSEGMCGLTKNERIAFFWWKKAADNNNAFAQHMTGSCYYLGMGVEQDYGKAYDYYWKSADQGNVESMLMMANCYLEGLGVDQDLGIMRMYVEDALNSPDITSDQKKQAERLLQLGKQREREGDRVSDEFMIRVIRTKDGSAEDMFNLGSDLYYGKNGVKKNRKEAFKWYLLAADKGLRKAECKVGYIYEHEDAEHDVKKALYWYGRAAEHGFAKAYYYIGRIVEKGDGVKKDAQKAIAFYEKGAELGDPPCAYKVGLYYYKGKEVPKDPEKAAEWFRKAADKGLREAQFKLGMQYKNGKGVEKNPEKAFYWISQSAEQGYPKAQNNLGVCFANGEGTEKDPEKAFYWYYRAAEQGNTSAQYNLGRKYQKGEGIVLDTGLAAQWFLKAAKKDNADAMYHLAEIYADGFVSPNDDRSATDWLRTALESGKLEEDTLAKANALYEKLTSDHSVSDSGPSGTDHPLDFLNDDSMSSLPDFQIPEEQA